MATNFHDADFARSFAAFSKDLPDHRNTLKAQLQDHNPAAPNQYVGRVESEIREGGKSAGFGRSFPVSALHGLLIDGHHCRSANTSLAGCVEDFRLQVSAAVGRTKKRRLFDRRSVNQE